MRGKIFDHSYIVRKTNEKSCFGRQRNLTTNLELQTVNIQGKHNKLPRQARMSNVLEKLGMYEWAD